MRRVPALLLSALLLLGTTFSSAPRFCPLCAAPVTVQIPLSTNDFGGQDRDLLRRAAGAQVFMEVTATCGHCGFTGWPDDFPEAKPRRHRAPEGEGLTEALREAFAAENAVKLPDTLASLPRRPEAPWADLPAWARLDLLAQTVALRGGDPEKVADLWLQASWAVRLGWFPVHHEAVAPTVAQHDWLMARIEEYTAQAQSLGLTDRADLEVWDAVRLLVATADAGSTLHCLAASTGVSLLREHGEHPALLSALPLLQPCTAPEAWTPRKTAIEASVALERGYQRQARDGYLEVLGGLTGDEAAVATYLVGEISRRLGEPEVAQAHFDAATAMSPPEGLGVWIREQRCLLDEPDPLLAFLRCRGAAMEPEPRDEEP
jgi:hypothetical protein